MRDLQRQPAAATGARAERAGKRVGTHGSRNRCSFARQHPLHPSGSISVGPVTAIMCLLSSASASTAITRSGAIRGDLAQVPRLLPGVETSQVGVKRKLKREFGTIEANVTF